MIAAKAELLLRSGRLWDARQIEDDAIAIAGGRILAVGRSGELESLIDQDTTVLDCEGKRVIPALIDSHIHLVRAGSTWERDVHWQGMTSLSGALEAINSGAEGSGPGDWVAVLGGWHPNQFTEGRAPTSDELRHAAPDNPVFVQRNYIEAYLNPRALDAMGWTAADRPGGVEVDQSGEPTGRVEGPALLAALRSKLAVPPLEDQVAGTAALLRRLNSFGLGGAIDAGGFGMSPDSYEAFFELHRRGEKGFRTRLLLGPATPGNEENEMGFWMNAVEPGEGDEYLRYLGAGEVVVYSAHDMEGLDRRDISDSSPRLEGLTRALVERGWPVHIHAILDRSIETVLDTWESVGSGALADLRSTITHGEGITSESIRRVAKMRLGMTIQNGMSYRGMDSTRAWGVVGTTSAPPLRSILEAGIPLGAGTDATVVSSFNPWECIWWMVTGETRDGSPPRVEEERIDLDTALRLYTSGSAWFSFEESERGNLNPGSWADITVLATDPFAIDPKDLTEVTADLTIVGGEVVFDRNVDQRPR